MVSTWTNEKEVKTDKIPISWRRKFENFRKVCIDAETRLDR